MEGSLNMRGIDNDFAKSFKNSELFKLYNDHKQDLFIGIRNNYINLYHNAASVCMVSINKDDKIKCKTAKKYLDSEHKDVDGKTTYKTISDDDITKNYHKIIDNINKYHSPKEKSAQQKLIYNNNLNSNSNWFCIDMEYVKQRNNSKEKAFGRFDIIAVSVSKKKPYSVALIELKYDKDAIGGSSGIIKHAEDYIDFIKEDIFNNYLIDELISIGNSLNLLGIENPLIKAEKLDFNKCPEIYIITLHNEDDKARNCMQRYVLNDVPKCSTVNIEKIHGINITKKNKKNFTPFFLFSSDDGSNINNIIEDELYESRTLI